MKKLLILGATSETCTLVQKAEKMGVETFVVDPFENASAKRYSSHPVLMNCFDVDNIIKLMLEESIDGLLPGCADILVPIYEEVCRRLNKPCYVNEKLVAAFNNKKGLKDILMKHGLSVIEEYDIGIVRNKSFNKYPVFVKPVDNNSSKGMSIAFDRTSFDKAYEKAIQHSRSKTVLIESYKKCDDFLVGYFAHGGKIDCVFTGDRFIIEQEGVGTITSALVYPSKYSSLYFETTHQRILEIFEELGFYNGICMIQGFVENEKILFYDPALRITGGQEYLLLEKLSGLDELSALINFAVTGIIPDGNCEYINNNMNGWYACNLAFSVKGGTIGRIDGVDYLKTHSNVINVTQEHFPGDVIDRIGTAQQNIIRIHVVAKTRIELKNTINDLQKHLIAYDINGNNMMLDGFGADKWYFER